MNEKEIIIAASIALSLTLMLASFPKRQNIARILAVFFLSYADSVDERQRRKKTWTEDIKGLVRDYPYERLMDLVETKNK